jgi:hypothetical protein
MLRLALAFFFIIAFSPHAVCQDRPDAWENLHQLHYREKIKVVDAQLRSWTGNFLSVTPEAVVIRTLKGVVTIKRADVLRVSSIDRSKRLRNAGIAFAACGLTTTALTAPEFRGFAGLLGAWAGGACAGGAALVPHYPTLYRSSARPGSSTLDPQEAPESQRASNAEKKGAD